MFIVLIFCECFYYRLNILNHPTQKQILTLSVKPNNYRYDASELEVLNFFAWNKMCE